MSEVEATIVIPTRDRWNVLRRAALASALAQEDLSLEIVVVDDGSSDGTHEHLAGVGDPRLRVIRHERSLGVARARNAGIAVATGTWISFLDDDDLWSPRKLREQIDAATRADASLVYAAGAAVDADARFLFAVAPPEPRNLARELLRWNVIWCGCSNVAVRADLLGRVGGFDEELLQLADWDLWVRLALAGRAASCAEVLVAYTIHEQSMLLTDERDVFPEFDHLVEKHRQASADYGVEFDKALFTRWVARGHRRAGRRRQAVRTYLSGFRRHGDVGGVVRAAGTALGEPAVELGRKLAAVERRSALRKLAVPEPPWLARYR
jgi:glycosyltransferase involved in cell wall biosynthesis